MLQIQLSQLPHLLFPSPIKDFFGLVASTIIPTIMLLMVFSKNARDTAQVLLNVFSAVRAFQDRMKPMVLATNGNGHTNGNGNGNGASDLMKSVLINMDVEKDARESGDQTLQEKYDKLMERGRRDSDNFFEALHDLRDNDKTLYITIDSHGADIANLKAETAALRSQMELLFQNDTEVDRKLEMILHLLDPKRPTPPGDVIPLDSSQPPLEAAS